MAMVVKANRAEEASAVTLPRTPPSRRFTRWVQPLLRGNGLTARGIWFTSRARLARRLRARLLGGRLPLSRRATFVTSCTTGRASPPIRTLADAELLMFPTVSMALGPITAIYHARFIKYLQDRG
jgi:hypothetical protein